MLPITLFALFVAVLGLDCGSSLTAPKLGVDIMNAAAAPKADTPMFTVSATRSPEGVRFSIRRTDGRDRFGPTRVGAWTFAGFFSTDGKFDESDYIRKWDVRVSCANQDWAPDSSGSLWRGITEERGWSNRPPDARFRIKYRKGSVVFELPLSVIQDDGWMSYRIDGLRVAQYDAEHGGHQYVYDEQIVEGKTRVDLQGTLDSR